MKHMKLSLFYSLSLCLFSPLLFATPYAYMEGKVIRITPQKVIVQDPTDGMQFSIERKQVEKTLPKGKNLTEGTEVRGHFEDVEFVSGKK